MNDKSEINLNFSTAALQNAAADWNQLQHVKTLMGLSRQRLGRDDVLRLIDSRQIRWAWDIARPGAHRPEVRIWRQSLLEYIARGRGAGLPPDDGLTLDQVIACILPAPPDFARRTAAVRGGELHRRFLCCPTHLAGLVADGELCRISPTGGGAATGILYRSAFEFLKRRSLSI